MAWGEKEKQKDIDITELYRQNYEDALDEIRNLKFEISELKEENKFLKSIDKMDNLFYNRNEQFIFFLTKNEKNKKDLLKSVDR